MSTTLRLEDVRRAWEARDPELVALVGQLADQPDPVPDTPIREGALTFDRFLAEIRAYGFSRKPDEEQWHIRTERLKALEAPDAEVPLPDRLKAHEIIYALWQDNGPFARSCLLQVIATVPLRYGPWKALKKIFKEAEAKGDTEVMGALAARFDAAFARGGFQVSGGTMAYLVRRAWRYLRRLGVQLPAVYADACVDFLAPYTDDASFNRTWVANHIFYHESDQYNRSRFTYHRKPDWLKQRAYAELWQRSPRPLFSLLERAKSDEVRGFATACLKTDFRAQLRDVEPDWVARLVGVGSKAIDEFVVWILQNVPRFEQSAFRSLGLHEAVLKLFDSSSPEAQAYAADYARTHARDLPVSELVRLANNSHPNVRKLATDLLGGKDPRKDVGLDNWGLLLDTPYGHDFAAGVLRKSFGASELTPDWFLDRLFTQHEPAFEFVKKLLPQIHPPQKLGAGFFTKLFDRIDDPEDEAAFRVAEFALEQLVKFDVNTLDPEFLRRALVHPLGEDTVQGWVDEGRLKPQTLGLPFLRTLAYHPGWEADPWVANLKASGRKWAAGLQFNTATSERVLAWLGDLRNFPARDLGFEWLLQLVQRGEEQYHNFATEVMTRGFLPADFAPQEAAPAAPAAPATVHLGGATFLFTGKLSGMTRDEAEAKVKAAGGVASSSVTNKLYYLVIGDEGSPLYGQGKKGSKQVKAEELNEAGANIKIISETAFLQMLAGATREVSADATRAGLEKLWEMATAPGPADARLGQFAVKYLRRHHPEIHQAEYDRPVDPGAEIPDEFLTFDRVRPLFSESRKPLRDLALELAKYEFARWAPPADEIIRMSELPYGDVRNFVADALLADDTPETNRYRINPEVLSPAAIYSFCESIDEQTRTLGMELIRRQPRLRLPEEMFRLTESPDRRVRGFIIRELWQLYRDRGVTPDWKPPVPPTATVGATAKRAAAKAEETRGDGVPHRPEKPPASMPSLSEFLRRVLFEIPPGRLEPSKTPEDGTEVKLKLKPLPARKAKLGLIEVMRDLALEDAEFAAGILPLLEEFMTSRGLSERAACLVAVTRVRHTHPKLKSEP